MRGADEFLRLQTRGLRIERGRHPRAFGHDDFNPDDARARFVRPDQAVIAPHQRHGHGSVERDPTLHRVYGPPPRVADEHLHFAAMAHDFDVMMADHAELPAVARLVIGVRLAVSTEVRIMEKGERREHQASEHRCQPRPEQRHRQEASETPRRHG